MRWARRLKRVFELDLEHCVQGGGLLKLMAGIEDPWVTQKILRHLDAQLRRPSHAASARGEINSA